MKKLISSLMIGLIASTCAITTMAAPHDHKKQPAPHQINKKPLPHKHVTQQNMKPAHQSNHFNKTHYKNNQHSAQNQHFAHQVKPIPPKYNQHR